MFSGKLRRRVTRCSTQSNRHSVQSLVGFEPDLTAIIDEKDVVDAVASILWKKEEAELFRCLLRWDRDLFGFWLLNFSTAGAQLHLLWLQCSSSVTFVGEIMLL